jgi:hypothetical protein
VRVREELLAELGQRRASALSHHDAPPDERLERSQAVRDRGLREVERPRRRGYAAMVGDRRQDCEVTGEKSIRGSDG